MKNISRSIFSSIVFLCASQFIHAQQNDYVQLRESCFKAVTERNPSILEKEINNFPYINNITEGYKSILLMLEAKRAFSPFEKWRYFVTGRNLLESIISIDKTSIELRYLRFCVQSNLPFFLGYSDNIGNDKDYILRNWHSLKDQDLKERIRVSMLSSEHCNEIEKRRLTDG